MRSLYTDDIAGTRSRVTIFQKSLFKQKYDSFSKSNEKNPEHKKYEWHVPVQKQSSNSVEIRPRFTLKLMSEHTGLARSSHFDQFKKVSDTQLSKQKSRNEKNSSVLSHSGRYSIGELNPRKDIDKSPYFPHKYDDQNLSKIKWSGNRDWNYDREEKVSLPNITKSKLFSYM